MEKQFEKPCWHVDTDLLKASTGKAYYTLVPAGQPDRDKVLSFYQHGPVPGYTVSRVDVVLSPKRNRAFELNLDGLQNRLSQPAFQPMWAQKEQDPKAKAWRQKTYEHFLKWTAPHRDMNYPAVKFMPIWHGTKPEIMDSILNTGYNTFGKDNSTDDGFFGRGIYGTCEAEYAHRVYSSGALIVNWVAIYSAYPVIEGDQSVLMGKGHYENYDAHFIPVTPRDPNDPQESVYYACPLNVPYTYTEVVVFDSVACLPRYVVHLEPALLKPILVRDREPVTRYQPHQPTKTTQEILDQRVQDLEERVTRLGARPTMTPSPSFWRAPMNSISKSTYYQPLRMRSKENITVEDEFDAIPGEYLCPLTKKIMFDPVKASDGITYEREAIQALIQTGAKSPFKNLPLTKVLKDDQAIRQMIAECLMTHPEHQTELYLPDSEKQVLLKALQNNDIQGMIQSLSKSKALYSCPLSNGFRVFHWIASQGQPALLDAFLGLAEKQGITSEQFSLPKPLDFKPIRLNERLIVAVKKGDQAACERWIRLGAELNTRTSSGKTLLQVAAESGHQTLYDELLKQGLKPIPDSGTPQPLVHLAMTHQDPNWVALLVKSQADLNTTNDRGLTVLHKMVEKRHEACVKSLLTHQAQVNLANPEGQTPLHLALKVQAPKALIATLMAQGADCKQVDKTGLRPIDMVPKGSETHLFLNQQHRQMKQQKWEALEKRLDVLSQRVSELEHQLSTCPKV